MSKKNILIATIFVLILGGAMFGFTQSGNSSIDVHKALERMQSDSSFVLLNVRTIEEWNSPTGHLKGALLIPVKELAARINELELYKNQTIIAVCRSGNRSGWATEFLKAKGFTVLNMEGGMLKWNAEKLSVVHEPTK